MTNIFQTENGNVIISKDVISSIAGYAASECYGIVGMSSQKFKDGIFELIGKDAVKKGIQVNILEDEKILVDVYIVVGYGTKISEVAYNVMEKIYYTVQKITGITLEKVNVIVQGVKVID